MFLPRWQNTSGKDEPTSIRTIYQLRKSWEPSSDELEYMVRICVPPANGGALVTLAPSMCTMYVACLSVNTSRTQQNRRLKASSTLEPNLWLIHHTKNDAWSRDYSSKVGEWIHPDKQSDRAVDRSSAAGKWIYSDQQSCRDADWPSATGLSFSVS